MRTRTLIVFLFSVFVSILTWEVIAQAKDASIEPLPNLKQDSQNVVDFTLAPKIDFTSTFTLSLSIIMNRWPPIPYTPALSAIDNSDQDNLYLVSWTNTMLAQTYILEEATNVSFSDAQVVYQGTDLVWNTPTGKTPGSYYYRVKARNSWGDGDWSNVQSVTIYPLFVGLQLRWDGRGYIRGSEYFDVGTHLTRHLNGLTDADTVRSHNYFWYDPNPKDWPSDTWDDYYSVSTGYFKASSLPDDPSWKWGSPWRLPYDWSFSDGQTFSIGGQAFLVSGPHSGYTAFGKAVQYWKLVNRDKFLYWDGGGDWKQYVHAGDITLWYDAGNTRLELHSNVLRRSYYKGSLTSHTVQYIDNLTSSNSFPSAHGLVQDATYPQTPDSPLDHQGKSSHQYDRFLRDTIFQADIVNESNDSQ